MNELVIEPIVIDGEFIRDISEIKKENATKGGSVNYPSFYFILTFILITIILIIWSFIGQIQCFKVQDVIR